MKKILTIYLSTLLLFFLVVTVESKATTINFNIATGPLTNQYDADGVNFSDSFIGSSTYATDGNYWTNWTGSERNTTIRVDFTNPVKDISLDFSTLNSIHTIKFELYNSFGSNIFTQGGYTTGSNWQNLSFTSITDVSYIDVSYENLVSFGIDNLIFSSNPVPEPATMLLFGIGLLSFAGISRRKK